MSCQVSRSPHTTLQKDVPAKASACASRSCLDCDGTTCATKAVGRPASVSSTKHDIATIGTHILLVRWERVVVSVTHRSPLIIFDTHKNTHRHEHIAIHTHTHICFLNTKGIPLLHSHIVFTKAHAYAHICLHLRMQIHAQTHSFTNLKLA